ncbi:MAG: hypothetical protein K2Q18_14630 [Bdellovibrionales bacterium]|nr:hypothetical protein [Bdellovibrionales bacterium]
MNFNDYVAHVKAVHQNEKEIIINGFKNNFNLMESASDVMVMSDLIVQVCAHAGEWEKGSELLKKIKNNATITDKSAMNRNVAILELGNNPNTSLAKFSSSDQVMINATVATALVGLGGFKNAQKLFKNASELAASLEKVDLAIETLLNQASDLSNKIESLSEKTELLNELNRSAQEVLKKYK